MAICQQQKIFDKKGKAQKSFKEEQFINKKILGFIGDNMCKESVVLLQLLKNECMGIFARLHLAQSIILIVTGILLVYTL